jgi:hypothetical protein
LPLIQTDAAGSAAAFRENDSDDGSLGVDCDLRNKDFEGGFLESPSIVKEELDAGNGVSELDGEVGGV